MAVKTTEEERQAIVGEEISQAEFDKRIAQIEKSAESARFWFMASRKQATAEK